MNNFREVSSSRNNDLIILPFNDFKHIITLANLWLILKACAYSPEYIISIDVSSVSDVVYRNLGVEDDTNLLSPLSIFHENLVVA